MSINQYIRKYLLSNRAGEALLLAMMKLMGPRTWLIKMCPQNELYPLGSIRQVKRGGIHYRLDISDYQSWVIYFNCPWDSPVAMLDHLVDARYIIDVGANIGRASLEMVQRLGKMADEPYHILAFEPYPENHRRLLENIALNQVDNVVTVEPIALSDKKGFVQMFKHCPTNSGGNRVAQNSVDDKNGLVDVPTTTLDTYLEGRPDFQVDFIKIDVEGFEYQVLQGARKTLESLGPDLFIELSDENLKQQGSSSAELLDLLHGLGYSVEDAYGEISPSDLPGTSLHTDIICRRTGEDCASSSISPSNDIGG